jgi:hypothetical protein
VSAKSERIEAEMRRGGAVVGTPTVVVETSIEAVKLAGFLSDCRRELNLIYGSDPRVFMRAIEVELWPDPLAPEGTKSVRVSVIPEDGDGVYFIEPLDGFPSDALKTKLMLLAP